MIEKDKFKARCAATRVLVVGDAMLDRYWFGESERISPEAPVPIVHVQKHQERLGGASNVAANVAALGAQTSFICMTGADEAGMRLAQLLEDSPIHAYIEQDASLSTTIKLRIIARHQQVLRVDFETPPTHEILQSTLSRFEQLLPNQDIVLVSDYAKGGMTHVKKMIAAARAAAKPVLVDPKGNQWDAYQGATIITPNRNELRAVIGQWHSEEDLQQRVNQLRCHLNLDAVLLTRSEEGMTLYREAEVHHIQTVAREVYDVSGAGDTVVATLAVLLGAGISLIEALPYANQAAGQVVKKLGVVSVTYDELFGS